VDALTQAAGTAREKCAHAVSSHRAPKRSSRVASFMAKCWRQSKPSSADFLK
jgi:hypothetical protein